MPLLPPDDTVEALTGSLVERTFAGSVEAARELRSVYWSVVSELATELGTLEEVTGSRVAMESHLLRLPVLATLYTEPGTALLQWALVGLREVLQSPVPYPRRPDVDPVAAARFEQAMAAAVGDDVSVASRIKLVLDVSSQDIGRWTGGVRAQAVGDGDGGASTPAPVAPGSLAHLARLADTFAAVLRAERVVAAFHASPVPLLGGLTYAAALDAGWDVDVLTDVVRHGGGRRPLTVAGTRYLQGPDAPAAEVLADYRHRTAVAAGPLSRRTAPFRAPRVAGTRPARPGRRTRRGEG